MARTQTASAIINKVAVEVGLAAVTDPWAETDGNFTQLIGLLNSAGEELVELHPWQRLKSTTTYTTDGTGSQTVPIDFCYMIDQTGWNRSSNIPLLGPASSQEWAFLIGRNLNGESIYLTFNFEDDEMKYFPTDNTGSEIAYEYVSRNWVADATDPTVHKDAADNAGDLVLYEPILMQKFLKAKFLEAKGFDASSARLEFENMFLSRTGKDKGAPTLSASRSRNSLLLLNVWRNVSDTGYGL